MDANRSKNDQVQDVPALLRVVETFARDNARYRADVARLQADVHRLEAEKAERDVPVWLTLKRAAHKAGCRYDRAAAFARRAIAAGRLNEARKVGGRVSVNFTALIAYLNQ
jgi:hypothetical protein